MAASEICASDFAQVQRYGSTKEWEKCAFYLGHFGFKVKLPEVTEMKSVLRLTGAFNVPDLSVLDKQAFNVPG